MNCQEALSLLYDIIDKESSEIDAKEVKEHLDKCKHCFEMYRMEQSIQDFIDEKLDSEQTPAKLDHLKSRILQSFDEVDSSCQKKSSKSFFKLPVVIVAAAASIIILFGAAYIANSFNNHNNYYNPLEEAHLAAVKDTNISGNQDVLSLINTAFRDYRFEIDKTIGNFELVNGHYEEILEANMMHLIYRDDGLMVSVFLASEDEFGIPPELLNNGIVHNDIKLFDHDCKGCRLVYQKQGSTIIVTASSDKNVNILEFIPGRSSI